MNPLFIMALGGIVLGLGLVIFTLVSRSKLPSWSVLIFIMTGVLIALSGLLIALGTAAG